MAQIRTINRERHNVKETLQELNNKMLSLEVLQTGIIELSLMSRTESMSIDGPDKTIYEPVYFMTRNIMMYY